MCSRERCFYTQVFLGDDNDNDGDDDDDDGDGDGDDDVVATLL